MNAEQLCEYLRGIHWVNEYTFLPANGRIIWSRGDQTGTLCITTIPFTSPPNYRFDLPPTTNKKHPWNLVIDLVRPMKLKTRKRKEFIADTISVIYGIDYTVNNSWRDRHTKVIFTGEYFATKAILGRRHITFEELVLDDDVCTMRYYQRYYYENLLVYCTHDRQIDGIPSDKPMFDSAESMRDNITRILTQYKKECPLLSEKLPIRIDKLNLSIAGDIINVYAPDFRRQYKMEARLQKLRAVEMLPQPIAEEIAPHLL